MSLALVPVDIGVEFLKIESHPTHTWFETTLGKPLASA